MQDAWLRMQRTDTSDVENLGGWLTTVVSRLCLNMLRSWATRREDSLDAHPAAPIVGREDGADSEHQALMADSIGPALLVVLDALAPAERIAIVLHDVFAVPHDEIAPIVDRSPAAARQLASRARRRVQDVDSAGEIDRARQRRVVDAFLAASRSGDFDALLAVLDPDVVLRADQMAVQMGASEEVRGAPSGAVPSRDARWRPSRPSSTGQWGAVWAPGGRPRVVIDLTITDGKIVAVNLLADPEQLSQLDLEMPGD